jgi:hypothetical protein
MAKNVEREPTRRGVNAIDLKRLLGLKDNPIPEELQKAYPQLAGGATTKRAKRESSRVLNASRANFQKQSSLSE